MFESWVSRRKNPNLREALLLRKAERYDEAWEKLEAACAENDGEAFYFKAHALFSGGWGKGSGLDFREWLDKALEAGCWWPDFTCKRNHFMHSMLLEDEGNIFVHEFCENDTQCRIKHELYAASNGCGTAQYRAATCFNTWYLKSANQNNSNSVRHMATCKECGDVLTRARFKIKSGYADCMLNRISEIPVDDCPDEGTRLQELYMYGKEFLSGNLCGVLPTQTGFANQVYYRSWLSARKTVLFWLLWTKKEKMLCPDIRRLIGKLVWETRTRPAEWGVVLMYRITPYTKRQKK
jgi:hypothetical protein